MPPPTTAVLFSATLPAPPPGLQNTVPQSDGAQPAQKVSEYMPAATAALAGAVRPDGTTLQVDANGVMSVIAAGTGGVGGTGVGGGGFGPPVVPSGAKDGSNTQYTIPSTVLAGTGYQYVTNGVAERQLGINATFAVQGTQLTRKYPLQSDDWHEFYYTPGTPSSESGGGGSVTPAAIRGSVAITTFTASLVLSLPAGSQAGDLALLICTNSGGGAAVPSGWTSVATGGQPAGVGTITWLGFAASKILSSGDIATGTVTVNTSGPIFNPSSNVAAAIVTFVGPTSGVREGHANTTGMAVPNPDVLATSSAVLSSDVGIFFGCSGLPTGGATMSVSPGSVLQSPNTADAMAVLAIANMPAGVSNISFTRSPTFNGAADFVVIVIP